MAYLRQLKKIIGPLSHLPTWFFLIGYPLFWLDLKLHLAPYGVCLPISWGIWVTIALISLMAPGGDAKLSLKKIFKADTYRSKQDIVDQILWVIGFLFSVGIIAIVVLAALKPIHLLQESDCLQYHYTLPRQHLILGSFAHIPWAADDLFLLPIDFALAPFWLATVLPNKIPQLIILFGLIAIVVRLTRVLAGERRKWVRPLIFLVFLGTHGLDIQMGTGMLDIVIAYLFLAALDSLRMGYWFLAAVEFSFCFWSKPLMPLGITITILIWILLLMLARKKNWKITDSIFLMHWPKALWMFFILSLFIAGPFVVKSIEYAGTPLFPLAPGIMADAKIKQNAVSWQDLNKSSQMCLNMKNSYGHGQGLINFIKQGWLLSVPEKGVNNAFDYPLGLTYLLLSGPFLFFFFRDIFRREFSALSIFVVISWLLWWFSTQQSRFLYVPLLIMFIVTIARFERLFRGLLVCVLISLLIESISFWGAYKNDLMRWGMASLRPQDQQLVELNQRIISRGVSDYIDWPSHDVAYAQFPVMVRQEKLPFTIRF